jgi:hypothetical protein
MVGDLPYAQRIAWRRHRLLWVSQGVRLRRAWRTGQREGVCALQALVGPSLERIRPPPYSASSAWTAHGRFQDPYARCARSHGTEMITVNLGYVDLGQVDVMVQEGFTPTAPTSSAPRSATSSNGIPIWSRITMTAHLMCQRVSRPKAPIAQFASTRIRRRGSLRPWRCHA